MEKEQTKNQQEKNQKKSQKLQWHPAFCSALRLELLEDAENLEFTDEFQLTEKPLQIDCTVVKVKKDCKIKNEIGKIFRKHNIFEYKSPKDELNIDTFYKVVAYACLYKVLPNHVDEIPAEEITITLIRDRKPVKLLGELEKSGYGYKKEAAGPYDAKSRYEVEDILKIKKWFDVQKETNGSVEITKYLPLENCHEIKTLYNDVFAGSLSKIDKLMDLFKGKNSDFCESIATLYAVWKNRLNNNLTCSNSELIADFKMWSKSKERFYDSDLLDRILFMRRKGLTPDSNIKK